MNLLLVVDPRRGLADAGWSRLIGRSHGRLSRDTDAACPHTTDDSDNPVLHRFRVLNLRRTRCALCVLCVIQVNSRLPVSGIHIQQTAASRNAAPATVNATPKPRVAARLPTV